jgi:RHS repeat-associated protein
MPQKQPENKYRDLYSFGSIMPGREYTAQSVAGYRFGFNGKESDNEIKVEGGSYDFGARIYDGRLGRFISLDPSFLKFPSHSPFVYCFNNPICLIDVFGEEPEPPRILDRSQPHIKYEYYTKVTDGQLSYYRKAHYYNMNYVPSKKQTMEYKCSKESYRLGLKWEIINAGPKPKPLSIAINKDASKTSHGTFSQEYETNGATKLSIILNFNTDGLADEIKVEYFDKETSSWLTSFTTGMVATGGGIINNKVLNKDVSIPEGAKIKVSVSNDDKNTKSVWNFDLKIKATEVGTSTIYNDEWEDNWKNDKEYERLNVENDPVLIKDRKLERNDSHRKVD